ncbi:hypothetical protein AB0C90_40155 [Streptomyces sp. NPDC048550]|uniref:hypothetical protein n=1 Tax=Streptomyces sp. NPDC048550 TaxID=3155739 RepID=UPI00344A46C5
MSIDSASVCSSEPAVTRAAPPGTHRVPGPAAAPLAPRRLRARAAYAAVGSAVAGVWALGGNTPAWEHALRMLVLVLCVSTAGRLVGPRLARFGRTPLDRVLFYGLLAGKVLLVGVALLADWIFGLWFADPALITGVCLFAVVTAGGPALHRRLAHGKASRSAAR